jgi:Cys-tRNA(Pro) deacylase
MAKEKFPVTQAIRAMKEQGIDFILRPYKYEEKGGTRVAARELGVDEHMVVKTLVMEDDKGDPFLILMHGDQQVSTKALARDLGVKKVKPSEPGAANRHTGYVVGGTSPLGTRKELKVYVEETIMALPRVLINAGRKGLLAEVSTEDLEKGLHPTRVRVAI